MTTILEAYVLQPAEADPAILVIDPRFETLRVLNAVVERLHAGTRWGEGPGVVR